MYIVAKVFKKWIYHAELEPIIINSDDLNSYLNDGWSTTPATFAKIKDFGVDEKNPEAVQKLGEAIEGVKDRLNGELNIGNMTTDELKEYALIHFEADLSKHKTVRTLRVEVKKLLGE